MIDQKRVHFIGIGGIGMSGLAHVLLHRGYRVSGSDIAESTITQRLTLLGADIFIGHSSENLMADVERVVISSAINRENPELIEAKQRRLPIFHRSDLLAELFLDAKKGIAVAGCHGKTTVSSMLATVLKLAGKDPTCVVGGHVTALGSNASAGNSDIFVAEADESDATFLKYITQFGVITNIDNDHMDYYSSLEAIIKSFEIFASHIDPEGGLYICSDDAITRNLNINPDQRTITYGVDYPADIMATDIEFSPFATSFNLSVGGINKGKFKLSIPGKHNVLNALPVIAFCLDLGMSVEEIAKGLLLFQGAGRRFEIKGMYDGITVIDDYSHHPNEIKATLDAARNLGARRVVVIFQPHRYSRTLFLSQEFGRCFNDCDKLFITDIYAASEEPIPGVTSKVILDHMPVAHRRKVKMVKNVEDAKYHLLNFVEPGDVIFTMGAGTITKIGPQLLETIKSRSLDFAYDTIPVEAAV